MTLYERYINGQTEKVYEDIFALNEDAFSITHLPDIEKVLTETFERVSYNIDIIYSELKNIDYLFKKDCKYNFQRPVVKPLTNTDELLVKLDSVVKPFGFIPLSLKMFYKIVGSCNFGWDYETNEDIIWPCADPLQIISLDDLVSEVTNEDNLSYMTDGYEKERYTSLQLAADYLHKDNISGGPPYSLLITKDRSVDGLFLNEEHNTSFINYLRICFENCGFSRISDSGYDNDNQSFFSKVKPQLKSI
jgi:hypothetical protein